MGAYETSHGDLLWMGTDKYGNVFLEHPICRRNIPLSTQMEMCVKKVMKNICKDRSLYDKICLPGFVYRVACDAW